MAQYETYPSQPLSGIHTHTIILLHGRNSTGKEFAEELFDEIDLQKMPMFANTKWLFPNAPSTYSEQFREDLTEWFDLPSTSNPYDKPERQIPGLMASVERILKYIDYEIDQGIAPSDIFIGGMSQGYAIAVHVLMSYLQSHYDKPLGGFLGISGWMPVNPVEYFESEPFKCAIKIPGNAHFEDLDIPILLMHCTDDDVIDVQLGRDARQAIDMFGVLPFWKEYEHGGHALTAQGGLDICEFFAKHMQWEEYDDAGKFEYYGYDAG